MSKTTAQILSEIIAFKEANSNLSGLTSTSLYSKWRNLYATASAEISIFEQLYDQFLLDLEYQKLTTPVYTQSWWNDQMLNYFQYSTDPDKGVLKINDQFQYFYTTEDDATKIIKFSATKQSDNSRQTTIKVAKDDGTGVPEVLTLAEISAAKSFVDRKKGAGLLISVVSFPSDKIKLNVDIYFDGQYVLDDVKNDCIEAIKGYFATLEFDGDIRLQKIVDAIQSVQGVEDLEVKSTSGLQDGGTYQAFTRKFITKSGYAQLDEVNSLLNLIVNK